MQNAMRISPSAYTKIVAITWFLLSLIILTGAAVRLSSSGLGCEDWPQCDEHAIIEQWSYHRSIEMGNRILTAALVGPSCILSAVGALMRNPRRVDLILGGFGLLAGAAAQVLVGRYSVESELNPLIVGTHFGLSMVMLWNVIWLWVRSKSSTTRPLAIKDKRLKTAIQGLPISATSVLCLGVVVTGTGPHGGDVKAQRLDFNLLSVIRLHSLAVWLFLALLVATMLLMKQPKNRLLKPKTLPDPWLVLQLLVVASVAQALVGYGQYLAGIPPWMVELHILGAIVVWSLCILFRLVFTRSKTLR